MKKSWFRNCAELIILIAIIATVYTQRVGISQWFREMMETPVPEAVGFEEIKNDKEDQEAEEAGEAEEAEKVNETESAVILSDSEGSKEKLLPETVEGITDDVVEEINLAVPFTSQAPHANWDLPYKETCEEASLYMVDAYYKGVKSGKIDADTADAEILKIVEFEKKIFGYYEDTTAEQTGTLAEMMYGHEKIELIENPTVEQIKKHVAEGHPVIVPAAGRLLGNPNFTAPGPIYHMIVIRGYTKDGKFITNDPGTKNGEAYVYDFDTVMNAMHDWNNGAEITEGKKVVLIVYP
ncbi:C39 family peptidase [Candidatus Uhrbacteria bacterium]|nr:C39 family peptidase [Candidatus Uhrbacteria bacterium]